jgi:hypothetical protein
VELDPKFIEFVENLKEVLGAPREPVAGPNQDRVETTSMRIFEKSIQGWPPNLGSADAVIHVFFNDFVAALPRELAQLDSLGLRILIERRNPEINGCTLHTATSI